MSQKALGFVHDARLGSASRFASPDPGDGSQSSGDENHRDDRQHDSTRGEPRHERGGQLYETALSKRIHGTSLPNRADQQDRHGEQAVADAQQPERPARASGESG